MEEATLRGSREWATVRGGGTETRAPAEARGGERTQEVMSWTLLGAGGAVWPGWGQNTGGRRLSGVGWCPHNSHPTWDLRTGPCLGTGSLQMETADEAVLGSGGSSCNGERGEGLGHRAPGGRRGRSYQTRHPKDGQEPPEAGRDKEGPSPRASGESRPWDLMLPASKGDSGFLP